MELADLVILLLAAARITILFVYDDITSGLRDRIFYLSPPEDDPARAHWYQHYWKSNEVERAGLLKAGASKRTAKYTYHEEKRAPGFIGQALSCPDCTGVWVGATLTISYLLFPEETVAISLVFALGMIASWIPRRGGYK